MSLPAFITPLQTHWPLPQALAGVRLVSCGFDKAQLLPGDFAACGIAPPASIQRSVAKRQAEFLAGRMCARDAVQQVCGQAWVAAIGDDRAPVWPAGVTASITHGAGWAACIAARRTQWQGLGLDVEALMPVARAERLLGEILTPAERERLPSDEALRALAVTLTFSLKESLFKALYPLVLTRFWFEDAELLSWNLEGQAHLRLLTTLSPEWPAGTELAGQFALNGERLLSLVMVPGQG